MSIKLNSGDIKAIFDYCPADGVAIVKRYFSEGEVDSVVLMGKLISDYPRRAVAFLSGLVRNQYATRDDLEELMRVNAIYLADHSGVLSDDGLNVQNGRFVDSLSSMRQKQLHLYENDVSASFYQPGQAAFLTGSRCSILTTERNSTIFDHGTFNFTAALGKNSEVNLTGLYSTTLINGEQSRVHISGNGNSATVNSIASHISVTGKNNTVDSEGSFVNMSVSGEGNVIRSSGPNTTLNISGDLTTVRLHNGVIVYNWVDARSRNRVDVYTVGVKSSVLEGVELAPGQNYRFHSGEVKCLE